VPDIYVSAAIVAILFTVFAYVFVSTKRERGMTPSPASPQGTIS